MEQQTLVFLGPQGGGKGTQVTLLEQYLRREDVSRQTVVLSVGKMLRDFSAREGYTAQRVRDSLARGEMQPGFISGYLTAQYLLEQSQGTEHLIFDGYPRSAENFYNFDSAMSFYKRPYPTLLYVRISDDAAVERLLKRGRSDDTPEGIRKRLGWAHEQEAFSIDHFKNNPQYRFFEINGEQPIEAVHNDILAVLGLTQ